MMPSGAGEVARALYHALEARTFDAAAKLIAETALTTSVATGDVYRGPKGFLEYRRGWAAAFPDHQFTSLDIRGGEERAVVEYQLDGCQTGPLVTPRGHIPATGMDVQVSFCDVLDAQDGQVQALRSYFDSVSMLRQLGVAAGTILHGPDRRAALELYAQSVDEGAPQRHKSIVRRYLQDVFGQRNPAAAADTCAGSVVWHGGVMGEARGLEALQQALTGLFAAFPDLELHVVDMIAEADKVVVRFSLRGTHLGEFGGMFPTHNAVSGSGTSTYRIEDNRIAEEWWQGDLFAQLLQLGSAHSTVRQAP